MANIFLNLHVSLLIPDDIDRLPSILCLYLSPFVGLEEVRIRKFRDDGIPDITFQFLFPITNKPQVSPIQQWIIDSIHGLRSAFNFTAKAAFEAVDTPQAVMPR